MSQLLSVNSEPQTTDAGTWSDWRRDWSENIWMSTSTLLKGATHRVHQRLTKVLF